MFVSVCRSESDNVKQAMLRTSSALHVNEQIPFFPPLPFQNIQNLPLILILTACDRLPCLDGFTCSR